MTFRAVVAGVWLLSAAGAAHASCKDDIAQLEAASQQKATSSVATASGGQAEAAKREAPKGDQGAGVKAMQAQVALNDAKNALGKGDETTCEAAVRRARGQIDK